ncbi:hypothetical protein LWI28_007910 [Acer negundo]|uniref:Uncharacterized protein n=1 Tax=Acer negundo TaxID=4023 RepID=A0AAD5IKZ7_ACENE|nr:hypothetical protein LWI28_007910 [Acer negundo]
MSSYSPLLLLSGIDHKNMEPVFFTSNTFNASKRHKSQRTGLKASNAGKRKIRKRRDSVSETKSPQAQAPGNEKNNYKQDLSRDRIEKVLEQLVSSFSRIEDRVSSVEEHMMIMKNPTSRSIETRLKEVEQQLEKLSASPGFSCNQNNNVVELESDYGLEGQENDDDCIRPPGFIITAPEFPDSDDEEEELASKGRDKSASLESTCVVDKCETVNNLSEQYSKKNSAKRSWIFTCFFCSGLWKLIIFIVLLECISCFS